MARIIVLAWVLTVFAGLTCSFAETDNPADVRWKVVQGAIAAANYELASGHLEWIAEHGTPTDRLDAMIQLSRVRELSNDLPGAISETQAAIGRIGPSHFRRRELETRLIDLHVRSGTLASLEARVEQETTDPSNATAAWKFLSEVRGALGDHEGRRRALRAAFESSPDDTGMAGELAELESRLGDHERAISIISKQLAARPDDVEWTLLLGQIHVRRDSIEEAQSLIQTLIGRYPERQDIRDRAIAFYEKNRMHAALRSLIIAQRQEPTGASSLSSAVARWGNSPQMLTALAETADLSGADEKMTPADLSSLAEALDQAGDSEAALNFAQRAVALAPTHLDALRVLLALHGKTGNFDSAIVVTDQADGSDSALANTLDAQLFQLLSSSATEEDTEESSASTLVAGLMKQIQPGRSYGPVVKRREAELLARWQQSASVDDAIRLAHWQALREELEAASATVRVALNTSPENPALLEVQLDVALRSADQTQALKTIAKISALDPSKSAHLRSKQAAILMDQTDFDEALSIYESLVTTPGATSEEWMNLAAAQQRTGNYYSALDSWMTAFSLASPVERQQSRNAILAVIERLGLWDRGVDFLLEYAARESDEESTWAALDDALNFAVTHDRISFLSDRLNVMQPDRLSQSAIIMARAGVSQAMGDPHNAMELLSQAATGGTDSRLVWEKLLDAATTANDPERALLAATALARSFDDAGSWIQLAKTQELMKSPKEAAVSWNIIRNRFNRDPEALEAAAEFFARSGEEAASHACRLQAAQIDGASPATVFKAIEIAILSGDRAKALKFCEQILASTNTVAGAEFPLPGASEVDPTSERRSFNIAMRALGGLSDPFSIASLRKTGEPERGDLDDLIRLKTIRTRGNLSRAGTERDTWTQWCEVAASPLEAVWGWYSMGDTARAMAVLAPSGDEALAGDREQAFAWIGLKGDHCEALRAWIDESPDTRRRRSEFVFMALSRLLLNQSLPTERLSVLFPVNQESISERWQASWMLATHGHFRSAVELATSALPVTTPRFLATGAQTLASWHLVLRDPASAVTTLSISAVRNGMTLDQPAFHAWRMRWLLESDSGREVMIAEIPTIDDPVFRAGAAAIAAALMADTDAIQEASAQLVSQWLNLVPAIPSEDAFETTLASSIGAAQRWNLPVLACELAKAAMELDLTQVALVDETTSGWIRDIKLMTLVSKLQCSPPREVSYYLNESAGLLLDSASLMALARQLESSGHGAAVAVLRNTLLQRAPQDVSSLSELVFAVRRKGDLQAETKILEVLLADMAKPTNFPTYADFSLRLAELYMNANRPADALMVIDRARTLAPFDLRFAVAADSALTALGIVDARIEIWKEQVPHYPDASAQLIRALHDGGQSEEISQLLAEWSRAGKPLSSETLVALTRASAASDPRKAIQVLKQLQRQGSWGAIAQAAMEFIGTAHAGEAVLVLREGLIQAPSQQDRMACAEALILLTAGNLIEELATVTIEILDAISTEDVNLRQQANDLERQLVMKNPSLRPWLTAILEKRRDLGVGNDSALTLLIAIALDAGDVDAASAFATEMPPTVSPWQEAGLVTLAQRLSQAGAHSAAAHVFDCLYMSQPAQQHFAFLAATEYWRAGERHRSRKLVEAFQTMRWFDPVLHLYLANYFRDTEDFEMAVTLYAEIIARDPGVARPEAWAALGKIYAVSGDTTKAHSYLSAAYSNPDFQDPTPMVAFLLALQPASAVTPERLIPTADPGLKPAIHRAIIQNRISTGSPESIEPWLLTDFGRSAEGMTLLTQLASIPECETMLGAFWAKAGVELPASRALGSAHADYLLSCARRRDAVHETAKALEFYESAASAAPWRFDAAGIFADKLASAGLPNQAVPVLTMLLKSAPSQQDRALALASLSKIASIDGLITLPPIN